MVLGAYFDESIRDGQGSEPISVAGFVFKPNAYRSFKRAWKRMLVAGPTPTTCFHMTNLYARDYEYRGWSVEDRAHILQKALGAVERHAFFGIGVMFSQSEFEKLAPVNWKDEFGSIYSVACQMILGVTAVWMDHNKCFTLIAYFFEDGHKFWQEADDMLHAIGQDPEERKRCRYNSHTSLNKRSSYGLQAADLSAWMDTRAKVGFPDNHTMRAFSPIILKFGANQPGRFKVLHLTGHSLKGFIDIQVARAKRVPVRHGIKRPSLR
jgi:hypothetical protein